MPCETCHDSFWVVERIDGVDRVRRCDCWRATIAEQQLAHARIPRRYAHCELSNFEYSVDSLREAHRRARGFVEAFPAVDKGLLLRGRHGVGKTHLAVAMLKDIVRTKGARGYFYETRELLKLVRDTYAGGDATEMDVLRPVLDADIARARRSRRGEDLGVGAGDARPGRQHALQRAAADDLHHQPEDSADPTNPISMYVQLGARIRSRLFEMCHWVEMEGPDVREVGSPNPTPADIARYNAVSPIRPNQRPGGFPDKAKGMARAGLRG